MGPFKAAFINEIEKMYRKKKAVVVVIISLLAIVMGQLMVTGISTGFGLRAASGMQFPIMVLSLFISTILPLFTALVTIDIFSGEFSHNTMKIALLRPITRLKLYTAKISAIAFFVLANLLVVMVLSTLTGILFNSVSLSAVGLFRILLSYLVTLVPVMALALVIVFLANIFKSSTAVFFLSIILFIVFNGLAIVFPRYASLFITSMFDWYNLWLADSIPVSKLVREFLIMAGYAIMFYTAGYYLYDKKDL